MMEQDPNNRLLLALRQNDETRDVDYKAAMAWDEKDKAKCCSLVKDILAMANSGGGLIIIGVDELRDKTFQLTGIPDAMLGNWETSRINRFVQRYAGPPINTRIRRFSDNRLTFIAIDIPGFPDVPHLCITDYPGELIRYALYVRTANNESAPIGSSADFHSIIERAVRNRSDRLLASFRTILVGANVTARVSDVEQFEQQRHHAQQRSVECRPEALPAFDGFREIAWWPARFDAARFRLDDLRSAANHARVSYREQPFLQTSASQYAIQAMQNGIEATTAYTMPFPAPMDLQYYVYDYWQLLQSGLFFKASLMKEEALTERIGDRLILWDETGFFIGEAIDCLARLFESLGVEDENVTVQVRITGTNNRTVGRSGIWLPTIHERSTLSEVKFEITRSIEDWRAGRVELAAEITRELMLRFNWSDAPMFDGLIGQLYDHQVR